MERINVISLKGGVGKSLIALNITKKLSVYKKVVLIDRSISKTISTAYGKDDKLFNWKEADGIDIINLSCTKDFMGGSDELILRVYEQLNQFDVSIFDLPPLPADVCMEKDLLNWIKASQSFSFKAIVVLAPPEELIDTTMRLMVPINDYLSYILSTKVGFKINANLFSPIAFIVNQVKSDYNVNLDLIRKYFRDIPIFTIPFKKEVFANGINVDLKEIDMIVDYIKDVV